MTDIKLQPCQFCGHPMPTTDDIFVIWDNGRCWLKHSSGEGMEVKKSDLEKLLLDFYKQNF